jgi:hypothetical protein
MPPPTSPALVEFPAPRHEFHSPGTLGQDARFLSGMLPKLNFPKFDADNPKLWKSCCKNYFYMYSVDTSMWVKVATMHFEGAKVRWLHSLDHRVRKAN